MNKNTGKEELLEDPRKVIARALVELGKGNEDIVFVSCDSSMGASGSPFKENFPGRHFEFGIAEQSSMGSAAGLSISGKIPSTTIS